MVPPGKGALQMTQNLENKKAGRKYFPCLGDWKFVLTHFPPRLHVGPRGVVLSYLSLTHFSSQQPLIILSSAGVTSQHNPVLRGRPCRFPSVGLVLRRLLICHSRGQKATCTHRWSCISCFASAAFLSSRRRLRKAAEMPGEKMAVHFAL